MLLAGPLWYPHLNNGLPGTKQGSLSQFALRCAGGWSDSGLCTCVLCALLCLLCKPAGPAQWVCVLTEVQVGGGGVGEIKERWAGQSARPRQCSRQCVLRCMNCACAAVHWARRVDSCGAVILHPGALEPGPWQGSGALVAHR